MWKRATFQIPKPAYPLYSVMQEEQKPTPEKSVQEKGKPGADKEIVDESALDSLKRELMELKQVNSSYKITISELKKTEAITIPPDKSFSLLSTTQNENSPVFITVPEKTLKADGTTGDLYLPE